MKTKRPLGENVAPIVMLATVAAVAVPAVVWFICKMSQSEVVKKVLEEMK